MTDSLKERYNYKPAQTDKTGRAADNPIKNDNPIENGHTDESKNKETCGIDEPGTNTPGVINAYPMEQAAVITNVDELSSDGSASAFEGTESIDSHQQDLDLERKAEQLKNDPSGRSNY